MSWVFFEVFGGRYVYDGFGVEGVEIDYLLCFRMSRR